MSTPAPGSIDMLKRLVAFDTTSRNSNLELIQLHPGLSRRASASSSTLVPNAEGTKANLFATIGPEAEGGIVLSGHTDVVPVDGQAWTTDPWTLTEKPDGNLYGRGTCDMKGFIAAAWPTCRPSSAPGSRCRCISPSATTRRSAAWARIRWPSGWSATCRGRRR